MITTSKPPAATGGGKARNEDGRLLIWILIPLMAVFIVALGLHVTGVTKNLEKGLVRNLCKSEFFRPRLGKLCPERKKPQEAATQAATVQQEQSAATIEAQILNDMAAAQISTQKILTSQNLTPELANDAQKAWESLELAMRSFKEQGMPEDFIKTVGVLSQSVKDGQTQLEAALKTVEALRGQLSARDQEYAKLVAGLDALKQVVSSLQLSARGAAVTDRSFKDAAKTLAESEPAYAANLLSRYKDTPEVITMLLLEMKEKDRMAILQAMDADLSFKVFDLMTTMTSKTGASGAAIPAPALPPMAPAPAAPIAAPPAAATPATPAVP